LNHWAETASLVLLRQRGTAVHSFLMSVLLTVRRDFEEI
jgi:hypothetical protein